MEKLLPILSDSLRQILNDLNSKNKNQIAEDLLWADSMVELYNKNLYTYKFTPMCNDNGLTYLKSYIDDIITDKVRALTMRMNVFELSFTPKGKNLIYTSTNTWSRDGRQTGKPTRIIQKLLRKKYKQIDLEIFNNLLKSEIMNDSVFQLVSGDDISKYYNETTYYKINGTLGNSCMRYNDCSHFFDIYKDYAKMLICIKNDKILGRAIVWEVDDNIFMDRVYTCDDYLEDHFLLYAKEHKWWIRESNGLLSDGDAQYWIGPNDEYRNPMTIDMYISLSKIYTFMPYMDSFRYYDSKTHTLSTDPNFGDSRCSDTDGSYQKCKKVKCESCGMTMRIWNEDTDYVYYSRLKDAHYCDNCCTWNDDIRDYVPLDIEMIPVVIHFADEIIELPLQYVKCRTISETEYRYDGPYFIKIKDTYYYKNLFKWDFNLDKYIINEN